MPRTSRPHFSREFKAAFGETPHRYLLTRRLERTAELLRNTDRSVAEICVTDFPTGPLATKPFQNPIPFRYPGNLVAIAETEREALEIARRGMHGPVRRAEAVHRYDHRVLPDDQREVALAPLRSIMSHHEDAISAGAGTSGQIAERFAAMLEPGRIDYVLRQLPGGDMTFAEARRTVELFVSDAKPQPEKAVC